MALFVASMMEVQTVSDSVIVSADQHNEREDLCVHLVLARRPLGGHCRQPSLPRLRHDDARRH